MVINASLARKGIITYWKYEGRIATIVRLWEWLISRADTISNRIVEQWLKLVSIEWDFTAHSEIIDAIKWLCSSGYTVIYKTDSWDEVWPMVRFKTLILSILVEIPKEWEVVNYLPHLTNYLREKDELRFKISDKWDYDSFRNFQKTKNISAPMKILEVDNNYREAFENNLFGDIAGNMENLIIKYV